MLTGLPLNRLLAADAVQFKTGRCLRHRFRLSTCERCISACPHQAIAWTPEGLKRDDIACDGCHLCTACCPTGAFGAEGFSAVALVRELEKPDQPVIGCNRGKEAKGHVHLPCLGLLADAELLLAIRLATGKAITLNLSACCGCSNLGITAPVASAVNRQNSLGNGLPGEIRMVVDAESIQFEETSCSRRELFSLARRKAGEQVASMVHRLQENWGGQCYAQKALPLGRMLLLQVLTLVDATTRNTVEQRLFPAIVFADNCRQCTGCIGVCPTGALVPGKETGSITFLPHRCTACGLCSEFCSAGAVSVTQPMPEENFGLQA